MKFIIEYIILASAISYVTYGNNASEFTKEPVASTDGSPLTSTPARSDIECAVQCQSSSCSAMVFVPETQRCLTSASRLANFSSASVDNGAVYRRNVQSSQSSNSDFTNYTSVYVQVGARTFRVIQQRFKGNLSFARNWTEYEDGFGDDTDFWLGLKTINMLTPSVLRVEVVTWANVLTISEYSGFTVGNASTKYTMNYGSYIAVNASADSLNYHKAMKFSTQDQDNDPYSGSCSQVLCGYGGWWYKSCSHSNPNGQYHATAVSDSERPMYWDSAGGHGVAVKNIRLMLLV